MRILFVLTLLPLLAASGGPKGCSDFAPVSGTVFEFEAMGASSPIEGVQVSVLEYDQLGTVTTDSLGTFSFSGVPTGVPITFVAEHQSIKPMLSGTFIVDEEGIPDVSIQAVSHRSYNAVVSQLGVEVDPGTCQIATTVGKCGATVYDPDDFYQGEPGTSVTINPPLPVTEDHGPVYFDELVLVDRALTSTSKDGGVVFFNVPPGNYTLSGQKDSLEFRDLSITCEPGMLVNAAPPFGVQVDCP